MSSVLVDPQEMISIVYVSSAVRPYKDEEIAEILSASKRNNEKVGVTGMLLYKEGNFMQVLEGPEGNIKDLIARIRTDTRHRGLITLKKKKITEREFPSWSMAFKNIDKLTEKHGESLSTFLSDSLLDERFRSHPDQCYRLLMHFKDNMK